MFGDVRSLNTFLLIYSIALSFACAMMAIVINSIYTRPPYILSQDDGVVQWRNTEVFRLSEKQLTGYLSYVFGKIYNYSQGSYNLSPLLGLVDVALLDKFNEAIGLDADGRRLTNNERVTYDFLEARRTFDPRFPYTAILVRGVETKVTQTRDNAGNTIISSSPPENVLRIAYLEQIRPVPDNPWGLVLVGVRTLRGQDADEEWNKSVPLTDQTEEVEDVEQISQ